MSDAVALVCAEGFARDESLSAFGPQLPDGILRISF